MAKLGSKDDIADHAAKFINAAITEGKVSLPEGTSVEAATAAAAVPAFSAGTVALDENTGRPIAPAAAVETPQISEGTTVAPNATGALDADVGAAAEAAAAGRANAPRDERGQFVSEKPVQEDVQKDVQPAPKTTEQRGAAAEAAAGAVLDEWAEYVDIPFEHDDGSRYTVRAKKAEAPQVERFNRRQAQVDRHATWLGKYRPTFEPLITSGRLDPMLPVINRALNDQEFGDAVVAMYNRRASGLPLTQAQHEAAAGGVAAPAAAPAPMPPVSIDGIEDPILREVLGPIVGPLINRIAQLEGTQTSLTRQQQEQQANLQRQQREYQERVSLFEAGHRDIAQRYPDEYTGDPNRDRAKIERVFKYARDSGFVQTYGIRAGVVLAADRLRQERADTGSPAAEMLGQLDRATIAAASAQAAAARSVSATPTSVQPRPRQAPTAPNPIDPKTGKRKSAQQMMAEAQQYAAQVVGG